MDASGDFAGCVESGNRFAFLEALSFFIDPEGAHGVMNSHADAGGPEGLWLAIEYLFKPAHTQLPLEGEYERNS